jgi:hypothetical protein
MLSILQTAEHGIASVARFEGREARTLSPEGVSRMYRILCEQPRSAWTHEVDFRAMGGHF